MTAPVDSLHRRSLHKLVTNVTGAAVGVLSQAIVPRALGPAAYGDFSFVTSFFWQALAFLNLNSSTAFYSKLSQRPGDRGLVRFYFRVVAGLSAGLLLFLVLARLVGAQRTLWPDLGFSALLGGALWAILNFVSSVLADMADAHGLTVQSEKVKVVAKVIGLLALLVLFKGGWLFLGSYFGYQLLFFALSATAFGVIVGRHRAALPPAPTGPMAPYAREFAAFCFPLVVFTLFSVLEQMGDRWLLHHYSGAQNQGYYALSVQASNLCGIFTAALIPLLFRDNAIAYHAGDFHRLRRVLTRSINVLFSLSAAFSAFLAAQSKIFVALLGGRAFEPALVPFFLMCFFPVHQTLGQLSANLFFASDRIASYRDTGLVTLLVGLPLSFWLLGPKTWGALELGASGLAIKMVLTQVFGVNLQLFSHARFFELPFLPMLKTQGMVLVVYVGLAFGAAGLGRVLAPGAVVQAGISAALYGGAVLAIAHWRPGLISLEAEDLPRLWRYGKSRLGFGSAGVSQ